MKSWFSCNFSFDVVDSIMNSKITVTPEKTKMVENEKEWKNYFTPRKVNGRKNSLDTVSKAFLMIRWRKNTIQKTSSILNRKTQLVRVKVHLSFNCNSNLDSLIRLFVTLCWFTFLFPIYLFTKNWFPDDGKKPRGNILSRLNKVQPHTNGHYNNCKMIVDGENKASPNQVKKTNFDGKMRKTVDNAVVTVKNCMQDAISREMDNAVLPWIEMAVRSIIGSSRQGTGNLVQNRDRMGFSGNKENSLLMSALQTIWFRSQSGQEWREL